MPLQQNIHLLFAGVPRLQLIYQTIKDGKAVCKMTLVMTKQFYLHRIDFKVASHVTSLIKLNRVFISATSQSRKVWIPLVLNLVEWFKESFWVKMSSAQRKM